VCGACPRKLPPSAGSFRSPPLSAVNRPFRRSQGTSIPTVEAQWTEKTSFDREDGPCQPNRIKHNAVSSGN
jgi:hypothetical protein